MEELNLEKKSDGTCVIQTSHLEFLLILAISGVMHNPPGKDRDDWIKAIDNAITKIH